MFGRPIQPRPLRPGELDEDETPVEQMSIETAQALRAIARFGGTHKLIKPPREVPLSLLRGLSAAGLVELVSDLKGGFSVRCTPEGARRFQTEGLRVLAAAPAMGA